MPLSMVKVGETKTILRVVGAEDAKRRLQELGFVPGSVIEVIGENSSGLILLVKGVRLAINKGLASKVFVG